MKKQPETLRASHPGSLILLIDDDVEFLETVGGLLRYAGYTVVSSDSGLKGVGLLNTIAGSVRAVLLDFHMPRLDGAHALRYVRRISPQARIIGLTGVEHDRLPNDYRDGVDLVIHKPVHPAELIAALNNLLDQETSLCPQSGLQRDNAPLSSDTVGIQNAPKAGAHGI